LISLRVIKRSLWAGPGPLAVLMACQESHSNRLSQASTHADLSSTGTVHVGVSLRERKVNLVGHWCIFVAFLNSMQTPRLLLPLHIDKAESYHRLAIPSEKRTCSRICVRRRFAASDAMARLRWRSANDLTDASPAQKGFGRFHRVPSLDWRDHVRVLQSMKSVIFNRSSHVACRLTVE
jgi:hypothetical protein